MAVIICLCMNKIFTINLLQRVLVAIVGIPLLLWIIQLGSMPFAGMVTLLALLATLEFHHIARQKAEPPPVWFAVLGTLLLQTNYFYPVMLFRELLLLLLLSLLVIQLFVKGSSPLLDIGSFLPGFLYVNLSFGALMELRLRSTAPQGESMVFLLFFCVWAADVFAYFGGSFLGGRFIRRKLFERMSPNKTWEGFLAGFAGSIAVSLLFASLATNLSLQTALQTGVLIGLASPVGDLVESMFKRDAGIKNSSALIPGHGGVLDRFDTIMFVSPFIYFITRYF